ACMKPTILLDASYSPVPPEYRYRWFFESSNYNLGRFLDESKDKSMGNFLNICMVFSSVKENGSHIALACYEHAKTNHSLGVLLDKLEQAVENSSSNFDEMNRNGVFVKPFW